MKKTKKKLSLKKKTVFNLSDDELKNIKGGGGTIDQLIDDSFLCGPGWTGGCTDGCGGGPSIIACFTDWHCTQETCTTQCPTVGCSAGC